MAATSPAPGTGSTPSPTGAGGDIGPRIVSGLVLAAVALVLNGAGPRPFAGLVLVVALLMCWEWGRMVRRSSHDATFVVHAAGAAVAILLAALAVPALGVVALIVGAVLVLVLEPTGRGAASASGVGYVGLPAVALVWLRLDEPHGAAAVLFVLLIVWTSDTAAFATGRSLGGPKLWPRVSPNKTWSGFLGALAASTIAGALFATIGGVGSPGCLAAKGLLLGFVAQLGDLAESSFKRGFGIKDASNLIPGHGGFLDRADSLVAVALVAALIAAALDVGAPARALLFEC